VTSTDWLRSAHSFAFGAHYDPDNLSFGPVLALNVDELRPGAGYPRHRHASVEILTWVLSGVLEHVDEAGSRLVRPGTLQYLAAGSGIEHLERSGSPTAPVRVVQMWLATGQTGGSPEYRTAELPLDKGRLLDEGRLLLAASGRRPAPIRLRQPAAELFLGRLPAGRTLPLPVAAYLHVFVVDGVVTVQASDRVDRLAAEDALRATDSQPLALTVERDAELLVWAMAGTDSTLPPARSA
jgi:redox-sensitive bicupin YhaK (pirin superfamily)